MINRRQFLKSTLALSATSGLGPLSQISQAMGQSYNANHFFVLVTAFGGMDVVLGLDPQVLDKEYHQRDLFLGYRPEDRVSWQGGFLGPAAQSLAQSDFASDLLIINGIYQSSENMDHEANLNYVLSGHPSGKSPHILANPGFMNISSKSLGIFTNTNFPQLSPHKTNRPHHSISDFNQLTFGSSQSATDLLSSSINLDHLKLKGSDVASFAQKINAIESKKRDLNSLQLNLSDDLLIFLAGVTLGYSQLGYLEFNPSQNLDTHNNHEKIHPQAQSSVWDKISNFINATKKIPSLDNRSSLYENMTLIFVSEFARTINLNNSDGKDHNPETNSMLILSPQLTAKGQVIGESVIRSATVSERNRPEHVALPIDYSTGEVYKGPREQTPQNVAPLFPENVYASLSEAFGISSKKLFPNRDTLNILPQFKQSSKGFFDF